MHTFHPALFSASVLTFLTLPAQAYDNNLEINEIDFNQENFLDIKAHRFRKSLEYQWYDSLSAWRISLASLDSDLAFVQNELKLQSELSEYVNVRLEIEQEIFFANQNLPFPATEIEIYPWAGTVGFSLLATPAYEKREMDFGVALIWGRRPWNYTRFEYIDVDSTYNEKNVTDNTFYSKAPESMKLNGNYEFGESYKLRFSVSRGAPYELVDPDNNGLFKHDRRDFSLLFDYLPATGTVIGFTINGFSLNKTSSQTGQDQQQATDYISTDIYWVTGMGSAYELRFGTQYDSITNDIRDFITAENNLDYSMNTVQVYATAYHPFNEHMAWDLGFYLGQVEEKQNYLQNDSRDTVNDGVQAKFRMGFAYSSLDGSSTLQLNISLNVDNPINDPGDGAGISYQSTF